MICKIVDSLNRTESLYHERSLSPGKSCYGTIGLSGAFLVWCVLVGEDVRARHQTLRQERAENCVECKAKSGRWGPRGV